MIFLRRSQAPLRLGNGQEWKPLRVVPAHECCAALRLIQPLPAHATARRTRANQFEEERSFELKLDESEH